ncbi:CPBP family intramembrane glutamic endopeptidase [uncultured Thiodictyon sp.]|uniref:CPBP family intramembrane glutamic endopeptidase n=1 Tax=uncultured Thiodictyon sp. TaxID=1846217 RepID=UPI0025F11668|nr:CPBP family intramembrane glutamic endopeptidase [uncultured Thiodictyon sp.]
MRATLLAFLFLFACLLLAAVLSVPLVQTGWIDAPSARVVGRLAQVFILLGLLVFLRRLGLANRASLGYGVPGPELRRALGGGWLLGVILLAVPALLLVQAAVLVPVTAPDWALIGRKSSQALAGGLLIALLEETFFRGALFSAIRRREGWVAAALWPAALYALVHFLKPGRLPAGMAFDWSGAFYMVSHVFIDGLRWQNLDSLAALFVAGVLLALVRERTGHIGWCIGLHAGWVWLIQTTRALTDANPDAPLAFLVGSYDEFIGALMLAWVGVVTLAYWYWTGPRVARRGGCSGPAVGSHGADRGK